MRAKSLLLLMLALGCGLIASIGITQVMAKRSPTANTPAVDATTIFVALEDIPTGDPITPQVVKLEQWPKDKVPPGALAKLEEVEGRRPKTKIYKGAPILENQLLTKGLSAGASSEIPKGYRVVPVKVDDISGAASLIRPGDRVDVLAHFERNCGKGIDVTKTQTILEDVKIFAINDVYDLDGGQDKKISAKTVSLLVTPSQAEKVTLAAELGKLRLVMRSYEDDTMASDNRGAVPEDLLGGNTETADRKRDDPVPVSEPIAKVDKTSDFLSFLKQKQTETPAAAVEGPQEPNNWTVRVIAATEVNDVTLQMDGSSGASSNEFPRWTPSAGASAKGTSGEARTIANPEKAPATQKEEPKEPQQPPQDDSPAT